MSEHLRDRIDALLQEYPPASTPATEFLGHQFDRGLAWVYFPLGQGGLDLPRAAQREVDDAIAAAGGPDPFRRNPLGHGMVAGSLVAHGSEALRTRYLRPLFTSEELWCQLFSEPGAGSDIAGLATQAVRDGDEWVVNGQKVWTSLAHVAGFGLLIARTDPSVPKHKGLTAFVLDMQAAGVEIRPLRQMTGDAEFNEVYMTDVRIPDTDRLGGVGEGWAVVMTTLMNERVVIGGTVEARGGGAIAGAIECWQSHGANRPEYKDQFMHLWVDAEVHRLTNIRAAQLRSAGVPGPEGSTGKLAFADLHKRIYNFCITLLGAEGVLYAYEMRRPSTVLETRSPQHAFLRSRANSIEGGTSEVMRNLLSEQVLGLPGDVRVDKDRPWSEVPR